MKYFSIFFVSVFLFVSCEDKPTNIPTKPVVRSILIYMAADNNLYSYAKSNITSMQKAVKNGGIEDTNIIVYIDSPNNELPQILQVTKDGTKVLHQYTSQHNSASKEILIDVIGRAKTLAPADKYSLILWSHASGWIPKETTIKSFSNSVLSSTGIEVNDDFYNYPLTKSFGIATYENTKYEINIPELTEAIPSNTFDYIMFDCCYMGSIEVIYNLRDKAKHIISAPTEILASGFPYEMGIKYLAGENPDLKSACESFFNYYTTGGNNSATISLYNTSKLEAVADAYASIITNNIDKITTVDRYNVQCYDRYSNHFIYDIKHFAEQFASESEVLKLDLALKECIEVKYNTPIFLGFAINNYSGVSTYIPWTLTGRYSTANEYYRTKLDWAKRVGLDKLED